MKNTAPPQPCLIIRQQPPDQINPRPIFSTVELEKAVRARGGYYTPAPSQGYFDEMMRMVGKRFRRLVLNLSSIAYNDKPRQICFSFIENYSVGAMSYATKDSDPISYDFIGIYVGALATYRETFLEMMSLPSVFPEVGSAQLEVADNAGFTVLPIGVGDLPPQVRKPRCPVRRHYAQVLFECAITMLFFHEATHLRFGHLELLRENFNSEANDENAKTPFDRKRLIYLQALEMDADCGAIKLTLAELFSWNSIVSELSAVDQHVALALNAAYGTPAAIIRMLSFVAYIMFRFENKEWMPETQHLWKHPAPAVRMHYILLCLMEILREKPHAYGNFDGSAFMESYVENLLDTERACAALLKSDLDLSSIRSVVGASEAGPYLQKLEAAWQEMRPELERYKRGGKLA